VGGVRKRKRDLQKKVRKRRVKKGGETQTVSAKFWTVEKN